MRDYPAAPTQEHGTDPRTRHRPKNSTSKKLNASNEPIVVRNTIGSIDYDKGEVRLNAINITSTVKKKFGDDIVEISAIPRSNDVIGLQDLYLQLDTSLSETTMTRFSDKEIFVEIGENVRGEDVFLIQSTSFPAGNEVD